MPGETTALTDPALRQDVGGRFVERTGLLATEGGHLAVTEYLPTVTDEQAVVICPSIMADFLQNLRREVVLSRWLADRGRHVLRFHHLGSGNSDGADNTMTLDQMSRDAVAIGEQLVDRRGSTQVTWLGTRLGAFTAVRAAAHRDDRRIALVDPVISGRNFVREGFRARMTMNAKNQGDTLTSADLVDLLRQNGEVDVVGHTLTEPMHDALIEADLTSHLGAIDSALVAQLGGKSLKKPFATLVGEMEAGGAAVTTMIIENTLGWWFAGSEALPDDDLVAQLGGWLLDSESPQGRP